MHMLHEQKAVGKTMCNKMYCLQLGRSAALATTCETKLVECIWK